MTYLSIITDSECAYFKLDDVISIQQSLDWATETSDNGYRYIGLHGEYYSSDLPVFTIITTKGTYIYVNPEIDIKSITGLIESLG